MIRCSPSLTFVMAEYGLSPPACIVRGKFHRFPGSGKGPGNSAGWLRLFPDGKGAVFGDFSTGLQRTWRSEDARQQDQADWLKQVRAAERQAKQARQRDQKQAAEKAARIWSASTPAIHHPYLHRKAINPCGSRIDQHGNLLIPVCDGQRITSLQFIGADGGKKFLRDGRIKGCWYRIGEITPTILIVEGFATGATLHQESGSSIICAFNSGNLVEVAQRIRQLHPRAEIIVCGDNDHATPGNPGRQAAQKAARAIGGRWTIPDFTGLNAGPRDTDYNDLSRLLKQIEVAA